MTLARRAPVRDDEPTRQISRSVAPSSATPPRDRVRPVVLAGAEAGSLVPAEGSTTAACSGARLESSRKPIADPSIPGDRPVRAMVGVGVATHTARRPHAGVDGRNRCESAPAGLAVV